MGEHDRRRADLDHDCPWLVLFPGLAIMFAMLGFSIVGDGIRDALDPTLERTVQLKLGSIR